MAVLPLRKLGGPSDLLSLWRSYDHFIIRDQYPFAVWRLLGLTLNFSPSFLSLHFAVSDLAASIMPCCLANRLRSTARRQTRFAGTFTLLSTVSVPSDGAFKAHILLFAEGNTIRDF